MHRVVHDLDGFTWKAFAATAERFCEWEEIEAEGTAADWGRAFLDRLAEAGRTRPTLGAYAGRGKLALLRLRTEVDLARLLPTVPTGLSCLDVVILHRLLLEGVLGIDPQAVREEKNLRYVRELDEAIGQVQSGRAQLAFLMNPTPIAAVWENALAGQPLPQKSTDFYPKLLSGLTMYWLGNPARM
jgi:hypothetical protein